MNYRSVSIVIPTYNGKKLLEKFLPSVIKAAKFYKGQTEIIIVDDAGTDGSDEFVRRNFPEIQLVKLEKNRGFSGACNEGFKVSRGEITISLDNDILVADDFIYPLTAHFDDKDVFGVAPGLLLPNQKDLEVSSRGLKFRRGFIEIPIFKFKKKHEQNFVFLLGGGAATMDRNKLLELGGFDELFNPFYWEDADLSYRAWKRGWKILYEPKARVYHQKASTSFRVYSRHYVEKISERNRYILVWKNILDKKLLLCHFLWVPIRLIWYLLTGKWWRISSFFLALKQLKNIRSKRKIESREVKMSDSKLLNLFSEIMSSSIKF